MWVLLWLRAGEARSGMPYRTTPHGGALVPQDAEQGGAVVCPCGFSMPRLQEEPSAGSTRLEV